MECQDRYDVFLIKNEYKQEEKSEDWSKLNKRKSTFIEVRYFNKRNLLGVTNSFGDFLGMAEPFTISFRRGMKKIFQLKNPLFWDDPIPEQMKWFWIDLIRDTVKASKINFARSMRPSNSVGGPLVAGLGDGAFPAYGTAMYMVWEYACKDP